MKKQATEPCDLSAVEALAKIQSKDLSSVELFDSCVARIEKVNPAVNAVVASDFDTGRRQAKAIDNKIASNRQGLLSGLPVGIKDLEATKGLRTTYGSLEFTDEVPDFNDPMVEVLVEQDGNIFCKTNVPEFGAGANTVNKVYGATSNPFNTQKTCGGSSGGTAVALATGMVPLATGSDYGGSLRTPAGFCGIAGFRPSPGVVPYAYSGVAINPFVVLGPMARTVADLHLLLRAQATADSRDPYSASASAVPEFLHAADLSKIKVACSIDLGCCEIDANIARLFEKRVATFKSTFKECDNAHPDFGSVHNAFEVLRAMFFVTGHQQRLKDHKDILGQNVIDNTERGLHLTPSEIGYAFEQQTLLYRNVIEFFEQTDTDVLICPAVSVTAFDHSELTVTKINDKPMDTYMGWLAVSYAPTMALCCSCVIPCGLDEHGIPFGIQIVGKSQSDATVLSVATALEDLLAEDSETARPIPDLAALVL